MKYESSMRTAEDLIAAGDQHFEQFSDKEMNVLFQYLREKNAIDAERRECDWRLLQHRLRCNGVAIDIFEPGGHEGHAISLNDLFHRLWTRNIGKALYCKMAWKVFRKQLTMRGISV
jgi:hypothetical protein